MKITIFSRYVLWVNLLLAVLLLSQLSYSAESSSSDTTPHLFGYANWFNPSLEPKDKIYVSMDAKRDTGQPWVFYYYIGVVNGDEGETRFESMPEGIPVEITEAYIGFTSKSMGQGEPKDFKILQSLLSKTLPDGYPLIETPDLSQYNPEQLRYQTLLKTYHIPRLLQEPASFGISQVRSENMKPVALYVITGQGDVPKEIQEFIEQTHGSWFQRYRHIIFTLMIVFIAVYGCYRYASR